MEIKTVQSMEEAKKTENAIIYDIDSGIELVKIFIKKNLVHAKEFKKLGKKQDGKNPLEQEKLVLQFVKKNLKESFKKEVSNEFFKHDELSYLDEKIVNTYIFGLFIVANGRNIEGNQDQIIARTLRELSARAFKEKSNKDFQEHLNKTVGIS